MCVCVFVCVCVCVSMCVCVCVCVRVIDGLVCACLCACARDRRYHDGVCMYVCMCVCACRVGGMSSNNRKCLQADCNLTFSSRKPTNFKPTYWARLLYFLKFVSPPLDTICCIIQNNMYHIMTC